MRIALIEPAFHFEVVDTYIKMFKHHVDAIDIYTSQEVKQMIQLHDDSSKIRFYLKGEESFDLFIVSIGINAEAYDIVIITTNESLDHSNLYHKKLDGAYLLVHNVNLTLNPYDLKHLFLYPTRIPILLLKILKSFLNNVEKTRTKTFQNYSKILLPSEDIVKYSYIKYGNYLKNKKVISGELYGMERFEKIKKISNQIKIVVPGTIDHSARNYKNLSVFLCSEFFNDVEIVFLGKIKNLSMISNLVQKGSKVEFVYQKNGFTSEEYEYHLSQADLAILPLKRHVFQSTTYEIQGKTLMSGSINDVSRFSIPFFYYEKISIPEAFKKVSISYKNGKHLNDLLQDAILNKSYLDLRNNYESLFDEQNYITKGQKLLNKLLSN